MKREWTARHQQLQLHAAARDGDIAQVEKFLQAKYPLNRFDELGKTPLHYAVEGGHLDIVDRLLRAGANVNAHDNRQIGNTPLSDNAAKCSFDMAQRLIEAGADPTLPGWMQLTAIHRAADRTDADARRIQNLLETAARKKGPARDSNRSRPR